MASSPSKFVWYELMTTDGAAAAKFYGDVVGWAAQKSPMPDMDYTLFKAGDAQVAGAFALSKEQRAQGAPAAWVGYIGVGNVDQAAADLKAAGGKVWRGPDDIPNVGRFAMVSDPQGTAFALFQPAHADEMSPADVGTPGHAGWHELYAVDGPSAFDFYAKQFGWKQHDVMDMGPAGKYQMFGTGSGEAFGGMMTKPAEMPMPAWAYYFNVPSIAGAVPKITGGGGAITSGPTEVPGGRWIVQATDPQGAHFALVGAK